MDQEGKRIGRMYKNGWKQEDSSPIGSDESVSISSLDSEQEAKDREFYMIMQEIKRSLLMSGKAE